MASGSLASIAASLGGEALAVPGHLRGAWGLVGNSFFNFCGPQSLLCFYHAPKRVFFQCLQIKPSQVLPFSYGFDDPRYWHVESTEGALLSPGLVANIPVNHSFHTYRPFYSLSLGPQIWPLIWNPYNSIIYHVQYTKWGPEEKTTPESTGPTS